MRKYSNRFRKYLNKHITFDSFYIDRTISWQSCAYCPTYLLENLVGVKSNLCKILYPRKTYQMQSINDWFVSLQYNIIIVLTKQKLVFLLFNFSEISRFNCLYNILTNSKGLSNHSVKYKRQCPNILTPSSTYSRTDSPAWKYKIICIHNKIPCPPTTTTRHLKFIHLKDHATQRLNLNCDVSFMRSDTSVAPARSTGDANYQCSRIPSVLMMIKWGRQR